MSTANQSAFVRDLRHFILGAIVLGTTLGGVLLAHADVKSVLPDFYAEPGLNPFRDPVQANANEVIDPFSGGLHLSHVDTFIPGNGGLDIKIQRVYNSNNAYFSRRTSTMVYNHTHIALDIPERLGEECVQNNPILLDGKRKEACSVEYSLSVPSAMLCDLH